MKCIFNNLPIQEQFKYPSKNVFFVQGSQGTITPLIIYPRCFLFQGSQGTTTAVPAQPASHPSTTPVPTQFKFHPNHGTRVKLSNAHKTAQRTDDDYGDGVVIARDPMQPQMLYEVSLDNYFIQTTVLVLQNMFVVHLCMFT